MFKKICTIFCLLVSLSIQAQTADVRVGQLVNESNWFELEQALKTTPTDSISPFLRQLATAMTHHYFNRPDSACVVLYDLLSNHQQELGDYTMNMVLLYSVNLARTGHYNDAADLLQNLYNQLAAMGTDSTLIKSYKAQVQQYRALAACGPFYRPLHKPGEYHIPMVIESKGGQHSIEMDGSINGKEGRFLFDTGAGGNLITPKLAKEYGLRSLDTDITVAGVGGLKEGGYAIADTLRIGGMTWLNVPFAVIDTHTGHEEADKYNEKYQLPPVIGLPVMLCMQEIQLDFARRELVIPAIPTPNPLGRSNLIRTDTEGLQLKTADESGHPVYFHFDTGFYYTNMEPTWYNRHRQEVDAAGVPDSLRVAGIGGVAITRTYRLPQMKFQIGNGTVTIDSINVNTGIDLHTGQRRNTDVSKGTEDGVLGLNALEKFSKVILNLKDMYMEAVP
ncbi:retropepsin-like aspartic protease [Phocaeicola sp.]|uniref:retropepsin-like aspartic protease n=1 Tax=Phocaeicola sp. TaxID=2773926 RepID=UPI002840E7AA|nr:retropepsin-like aspartic protease [Phocaeicola sp.]MDR3796153.1 retropepsin-like aspartic protease [Phocaeicola sp.]